MRKKLSEGVVLGIIGIIVAILVGFMQIVSLDPLRPVLVVSLALALIALVIRLAHIIYAHSPKLLLTVLVSGALVVATVIAYRYLTGHPPNLTHTAGATPSGLLEPPDSPEKVRKAAGLPDEFRKAQESYSLGDFEETISTLEPLQPFEGDEKLADSAYHLLGFAYLSLPQPRCTDAFRLFPNIRQRSLEVSLEEKCRAVSCGQCTEGGSL